MSINDKVPSEDGSGWSFSIQPPGSDERRLVVVNLADARGAEVVALKTVSGTVHFRSEVPPTVVKDMGLKPGEVRVI